MVIITIKPLVHSEAKWLGGKKKKKKIKIALPPRTSLNKYREQIFSKKFVIEKCKYIITLNC